LAATEKRPFFSINCATVREPQQWFGEPQAKKGSTYWRVSEFVKAIELGGCVIRLEELNRLSSYIQNPLLELLEDGRTHVEGYGMVEIGPDTVFVATMNIGLQYQGTYKMCESLLSRFAVKVEFTPLTEAQTTKTLVARTGVDIEVAKKLATVKAQVDAKTGVVGTGSYDHPITYRQLEAACHLYPSLGNEAIRVTILNHYDNDGPDSERSQCLKLVAGVGLA
jgi:MoxR-like ATPase